MFYLTSSLVAGVMMSQITVNPTQQCQVNFAHDLVVSEHELVVIHQHGEQWHFNPAGELFINQQIQTLDDESRDLLTHYQSGVYQQAELLDAVMTEAVDITRYALTLSFAEMFSPDHKVVQQIERLADGIDAELQSVVRFEDNTYYIYGSRLDQFGERLSQTLDNEIENIVNESMGSMLMVIGRALVSGNGSIENRMAQFEQRMEAMAATLETEVEGRAARLEQAAESMCEQMAELQSIEQQLQQKSVHFAKLNLFGH